MIHENKQASKRVRWFVVVSPLALALAALSAQAAERVDLQKRDVAQLNRQYKSAVATTGAPTKANLRHAELLSLDPESALLVLTSAQDADGTHHYRYQQTFRGIPIFGEQVIVSEDGNGNVRNLFGRRVDGLAREVSATAPKVSKAQALAVAKRATLGTTLTSKVVKNESTQQMIYVDDNNVAHMSYVVNYFADAPKGGAPTRPF
ncbi:MAG: peptidase M4 family protein, partial [Luteimonas sp.]